MKIKVHPDYPTLPIIVAQSSADKPQPGKFYVTYATTSLSSIALAAYGASSGVSTLTLVKRLNRSSYNMGHCVYRKSSSHCSSAVVAGTGAMNTVGYEDGAWLSLCNADKGGTDGLGISLGVSYQVIWVAPPDGREPWDLAPPSTPETPIESGKPGTVSVVALPSIDGGGTPTVSVTIPGVAIGGGGKTTSGGGTDDGTGGSSGTAAPALQKAGIPWWVAGILGLGAITTVIVFALRDKKKQKRDK